MRVDVEMVFDPRRARGLDPESLRVVMAARRDLANAFDPRVVLRMDRAARAEWDRDRRAWLLRDPRVVEARGTKGMERTI